MFIKCLELFLKLIDKKEIIPIEPTSKIIACLSILLVLSSRNNFSIEEIYAFELISHQQSHFYSTSELQPLIISSIY